jgi:hypothetical protein
MKYIYLYTTQTYKTKNWYKIGETIIEPIERIKQQDNASNPEPLILIAHWQVDKQITDKKVHCELETLGFEKLRGNREWFELSNSPEQDVQCAISTLDPKIDFKLAVLKFEIEVPFFTDIWWGNNTPPPCHI